MGGYIYFMNVFESYELLTKTDMSYAARVSKWMK